MKRERETHTERKKQREINATAPIHTYTHAREHLNTNAMHAYTHKPKQLSLALGNSH